MNSQREGFETHDRLRWWERNKDKVITDTIMTGLLKFFVIYLINAFVNDWDIRFD
ncbi:MAG: hypothetical protein RBG13Loki_2587 [Promethearchaeota archaeon CR_4]|nr:MAG: hypothetical protein RBG13Loki_2587 [Candidatus Lokiarchaeota archaeon CR_4]